MTRGFGRAPHVPVFTGPTPCAWLGDLFAWLSVALAVASVLSGSRRRA